MATTTITVDEKAKEACAVETMRRMLSNYSEQHEVPFDTAFFLFSNSPIYVALFDYNTAVWREGPDYLQDLFEEYLQNHA